MGLSLAEVVGEGELHWAGQGRGSSEPGRPMVWIRDLLGTAGLHLSAEVHFPACAPPARASAPLGTVPFGHGDSALLSPPHNR